MKVVKSAIHVCPAHLLNPVHPIRVNLIGSGGTGSHMLTALSVMNESLIELGHPGLMVYLFDGDIIEAPNKGRLLFTRQEIGLYKADVFVSRVNRFFGTNWKAITGEYNLKMDRELAKAEITISCVDSVPARFEIAEVLKHVLTYGGYQHSPCYWMDFGNSRDSGQVLLSTVRPLKQPVSKKFITVSELPMVTDEYRSLLLDASEGVQLPSCSLFDALGKQNLFINPSLAQMGASLLWDLFREGLIFNRGFFLNLKNLQSQPVVIQPPMVAVKKKGTSRVAA
jgi:PRTRC genetic system ThiF family protein